MTEVGVLCGRANRNHILAFVAEGDLLTSATFGFPLATYGFAFAFGFASEALCLADAFWLACSRFIRLGFAASGGLLITAVGEFARRGSGGSPDRCRALNG